MKLEGTVSAGTMRSKDLIPVFIATLKEIDPEEAAPFERSVPEDPTDEFWDSDDASFLIEDLFEALDGHAPDGYYFGAHPGDGCDYGYWPFEDA